MKIGLAGKLFLMTLIPLGGYLALTAYLNDCLARFDGYRTTQLRLTEVSLLTHEINLDLNQLYLFFGLYRASQNPAYKNRIVTIEHKVQSSLDQLAALYHNQPEKLGAIRQARIVHNEVLGFGSNFMGDGKQTHISDLLGGRICMSIVRWTLSTKRGNVFDIALGPDDGELLRAEKLGSMSEQNMSVALVLSLLGSGLIYFGLVQWFRYSISSKLKVIIANISKITLRLENFEPLEGHDELDSLNNSVLESAKSLRDDEAAKTQAIRLVAEELEYPLQAIAASFQDFLRNGLKSPSEKACTRLVKALSELGRLRELVQELTHLNDLQSSGPQLPVERFDLAALSAVAASVVHEFASSKQIIIHQDNQSVTVTGNWQKILQVSINLLSNAIKFSPPGSTVKIATGTEEMQGILAVTDEGIGISAEFRDRIFSRFEQSATTSGGSGLGLVISKEILEAQGGQLKFESPGLSGRGSVFWLALPITAGTEPTAEKVPLLNHPGNGLSTAYKQTLWLKGAMLFSLPFVLQAAVIIALWLAFQSLHTTTARLIHVRQVVTVHAEMFSHFSRGVVWAMINNVARDEESREQVAAEQQFIIHELSELKALTGIDPHGLKDFAVTEAMVRAGIKVENDLMAAPVDCDSAPWFGQEHIHETASLPDQLESPLLDTIKNEREIIRQKISEQDSIRGLINNMVIGSAVLIASISILLSLILFGRWRKRIQPIVENVQCLAHGGELLNSVVGNDELAYIDKVLHMVSSEKAKLEKSKAELVSITSHELRTPLTSLAVLVDILENGIHGELTDEGARVIAFAQLQIDGLISLITDLLDLEKMRSGKILIEKDEAEMLDVLDRVLEKSRKRATRKSISVQVEGTDGAVTVDARRIIQALTALISHCFNFMPEYSTIILWCKSDALFAEFGVVAPTGSDAADTNTSFSRHVARRRLVEDLARFIAEQHGGTLTIASRESNRHYTIRVPRIDESKFED